MEIELEKNREIDSKRGGEKKIEMEKLDGNAFIFVVLNEVSTFNSLPFML